VRPRDRAARFRQCPVRLPHRRHADDRKRLGCQRAGLQTNGAAVRRHCVLVSVQLAEFVRRLRLVNNGMARRGRRERARRSLSEDVRFVRLPLSGFGRETTHRSTKENSSSASPDGLDQSPIGQPTAHQLNFGDDLAHRLGMGPAAFKHATHGCVRPRCWREGVPRASCGGSGTSARQALPPYRSTDLPCRRPALLRRSVTTNTTYIATAQGNGGLAHQTKAQ
jgi:hypothetical protein